MPASGQRLGSHQPDIQGERVIRLRSADLGLVLATAGALATTTVAMVLAMQVGQTRRVPAPASIILVAGAVDRPAPRLASDGRPSRGAGTSAARVPERVAPAVAGAGTLHVLQLQIVGATRPVSEIGDDADPAGRDTGDAAPTRQVARPRPRSRRLGRARVTSGPGPAPTPSPTRSASLAPGGPGVPGLVGETKTLLGGTLATPTVTALGQSSGAAVRPDAAGSSRSATAIGDVSVLPSPSGDG